MPAVPILADQPPVWTDPVVGLALGPLVSVDLALPLAVQARLKLGERHQLREEQLAGWGREVQVQV
jgi:hypothetical protein